MQRYEITLVNALTPSPPQVQVSLTVGNYHELDTFVSQTTAIMGVGDTVTVKRLN